MDRIAAFLRTRPPVDEQGEEIGCADGAVVVEVGWAIVAVVARPPVGQQFEQVGHTDGAAGVKVPRAGGRKRELPNWALWVIATAILVLVIVVAS